MFNIEYMDNMSMTAVPVLAINSHFMTSKDWNRTKLLQTEK